MFRYTVELAGIASHDGSGGGMYLPKEVVKRMAIGAMGGRGPDSRDGSVVICRCVVPLT